MAGALGMQVLIAERRGSAFLRPGRVPFEYMLSTCTSMFITCPLKEDTWHMISHAELAKMRSDATIINVARGDVVDHAALSQALKRRDLGGYATDVLEHEASDDGHASVLLRTGTPNIVVTPHIAWLSRTSMDRMREALKVTIESFVGGTPCNVLIRGHLFS